MDNSIIIDEIRSRYKLLADRMKGAKLDLPMAYAMLFKSIDALVKLNQNRADIRDKVETALNVARPIKMPSGDEIAKLLGRTHNENGEK